MITLIICALSTVVYALSISLSIAIGQVDQNNSNQAEARSTKLVEISTRNILRSFTNDVDLLKITYNNNVTWSHLSLSWAFPTGNQEQLIFKRSTNLLSITKSILWSWHRGATMPSYRGRLSFKRAQQKSQENNEIIDRSKDSSDWITVEGKFLGVLATNISYLSQDVRCSTLYEQSKIDSMKNDKYISLVYIVEEDSSFLRRVHLCRACTADRKLNQMPNIKEILVSQLKLEPLERRGSVYVDGEKSNWENGPIDIEIIPGIARLYCEKC